MGAWHVIGRTDTFLERGYVDEVDSYAPGTEPAGIDVTFTYRKGSLDAPLKTKHIKGEVVDTKSNARWKVSLFPPFSSAYLIMAISPDYQWTAIAHPSRKYGWIMSRKPSMPEAEYRHVLSLFQQQGYDTSKFIKVPQSTSQR